ncbi:hypothetical protein [Streptomyces incarnatus]|uniref:hypothetical protein n=1 Tax=Streptomyces incarnatus TaxID=665007 RepID=UPI001FC90A9C|nr:hypothetical protein [Streptomyces incarnatus]
MTFSSVDAARRTALALQGRRMDDPVSGAFAVTDVEAEGTCWPIQVAFSAASPEHGDQEPEAGPREAVDLTALRALRECRTDVEALDLTAERLRHLKDAFTKAADDSRARADRYAGREDAGAVRLVC